MTYPTSHTEVLTVTGVQLSNKPAPLNKRGISESIGLKYGCHLGSINGEPVTVFEYKDHNGKPAGLKTRTKDKKFRWQGRTTPTFFGQHLSGDTKTLVLTEGEFDALAVATAMGTKYQSIVSIPDGAASASEVIKAQIEFLQKFKTFILAFDMDDPGRKAVEKVARLLPGKVKVADLSQKDCNEVLLKDGADKLKWSIVNARDYSPTGLMTDDQIREALQEVMEPGLAYPWHFMDEALMGQREGEVTVWLAGSGVGKTTVLGQVSSYHLGVNDVKVGMIFLEDSPQEVVLRMLSFTLRRNLYSNEKMDPDLLLTEFDNHLSGKVSIYDPRTGWDMDRITEAMRWMAVGEDCPVIILDHLSAVVGVDSAANEIAKAEEMMYKLRRVAITTGAHIHVVSHLRKKGGGETIHEEGGRVTLQDGKGTGAIFQVANTIVALERNTQAEEQDERDITSVRILKNRATGQTGEAGRLLFNRKTYRLEEYDGRRTQTIGLGAIESDPEQPDQSVGGESRGPEVVPF